MDCKAHVFTAARIAAALGDVSRQAVQKRLKRIVTLGRVLTHGQAVPAWAAVALPEDYRRKIATNAKRLGYRDLDQLLCNPAKRWEPAVPLAELTPAFLEKAARRRDVLAPILRECGETAKLSNLVRLAQVALVRAAGAECKDERSVRRWIEAALERDRGRGEFERLEIYFPDRLAKLPPTGPSRHALLTDLPILRDALALIRNPLKATLEDRKHLWVAAMDEIDGRLDRGESERSAQAAVLNSLEGSGVFIGVNRQALTRTMFNKRQRWVVGGRQPAALLDRRPEHSGNHRSPAMPEDVHRRLLARNVGNNGRLAQTWREMWDEGRLPADFYESYSRGDGEKSRVPKRIRDLLKVQTENLLLLHQGEKESRLRGPKVSRDWSQMPSGVQAQSDDCTLPVYFWIQLEDGSFKVLRGQFLPWIDTRTSYIHCFQLLAKETYSSLDIMRGLGRLNDEWGLPEELYFERGIWKNSLLISGRGDEVPWKERAYGLRDLGVCTGSA